MLRNTLLWVRTHERHLSALAMATGFVVDSFFIGRVDVWQTHIIFGVYTALCLASITFRHWIESRIAYTGVRSWHTLVSLVTQFALGGFWSGLIILYGRSAVLGVSWPFLLFLVLIFIGNEYFYQYHARLVFTSVLFFLALYSYAIFALPIYTGSIGTLTFLGSGVMAIAAFALFTGLLRLIAHDRFRLDVSRIRLGAFTVLALMNLFYFTNILPPLPLSAEAVGMYHTITRVPGAYKVQGEAQSFMVRTLGLAPTLHVVLGDSLSAYSSVFAPTALTTSIVHRWQWYDTTQGSWVTKSKIAYVINGGRDGGYRGYSSLPITNTGKWRVIVETQDGRRIAQLPFTVVETENPPTLISNTLK